MCHVYVERVVRSENGEGRMEMRFSEEEKLRLPDLLYISILNLKVTSGGIIGKDIVDGIPLERVSEFKYLGFVSDKSDTDGA